jgi:hypothetical protein
MRCKIFPAVALLLLVANIGCAHPPVADQPTLAVQLRSSQTCEKLGACQGASEHDGFIYLYGDANPGVIRQYTYSPGPPPQLIHTGLDIALTYHGKNLINHPTGLTWNPQFGTYLGNTVTATKKGTIYHLDWPRMLIDRNLDHEILNVTDDDEATQGCRPEFVRRGEQWLLATADYGNRANAVRYYDPAELATAKKTSDPGVLVASYLCGPYVQQLHWIDERPAAAWGDVLDDQQFAASAEKRGKPPRYGHGSSVALPRWSFFCSFYFSCPTCCNFFRGRERKPAYPSLPAAASLRRSAPRRGFPILNATCGSSAASAISCG